MLHPSLWCSKLSARVKTNTHFAVGLSLLTLVLTLFGPVLHAESDNSLRYAKRLLRVSGTAEHFTNRTSLQTSNIIRTYTSIVNMEADVRLPQRILSQIRGCYQRVYAWENFEEGIAQIISQQLSDEEMLLLIDFYRDLGMPPRAIELFKATIAKAPSIQQVSADFIFTASGSCVDEDANTINNYLASLNVDLGNSSAP